MRSHRARSRGGPDEPPHEIARAARCARTEHDPAGAPMSRVLVTGGAAGLGAALVKAFTARGDQVLSADLSFPVVEEVEERAPLATTGPGGDETVAGAQTSVTEMRLDVRSDDDWATAREWVEQ